MRLMLLSGAAAVLKRYPTWLSARADEVIE
jgi:hypothetical protein